LKARHNAATAAGAAATLRTARSAERSTAGKNFCRSRFTLIDGFKETYRHQQATTVTGLTWHSIPPTAIVIAVINFCSSLLVALYVFDTLVAI
jgi:hypothetical protein